MTTTIDALVEAAQAVVARWDSPKWKDEAPTADAINTLRAALALARAEQADLPDSSQKRMLHDFPLLQAFHTKHALGPMLAPSCLSCGQQTNEATRPVSVRHMELPGIVVCKVCHDAARAEQAEPVAALPNIPGLAADPSAFVRWAEPNGYDMTSHPLHFLFLNEKTSAARAGWKAAVDHYKLTTPPAPVPQPVQVEPVPESEMNRSWFLACKEIIDRCVAPDMYADARAMLDKALYESMIAAAPPPPKREPLWQPIETAPKDGYMLVHEDGAIRALFRSRGVWQKIGYPAIVATPWGDALVGQDAERILPQGYRLEICDGCCEGPTHWMPLPDAPTEAAHGITPKEGG